LYFKAGFCDIIIKKGGVFMGTSLFIARIFGLCYLVIGIGFLVNRKTFQQIIVDFCKNTALMFLAGLLALVVGTIIILSHNVWVANWTVIITIIGWLGFIKGVLILVFPATAVKLTQLCHKNENFFLVRGIVVLILGAVLTYLGFFGV